MSKNWVEMDGYGGRCLETISQDIEQYHRLSPMVQPIRSLACTPGTETLLYELVKNHLAQLDDQNEFDPQKLVIEMSEDDKNRIVGERVVRASMWILNGVDKGTGFGAYGKRARVTALESGVVRTRRYSLLVEPKSEISEGATIEGQIFDFSSLPEFGGRLVLDRFFGYEIVEGLVDPNDAHPKVSLDILGK